MKIRQLKFENQHILNRSNCEKFKERILVKFDIFNSCLTVFDVRTLLFYTSFIFRRKLSWTFLRSALDTFLIASWIFTFICSTVSGKESVNTSSFTLPQRKNPGALCQVIWMANPAYPDPWHRLCRSIGQERCDKQCTCCKTPVGRSPVLLKQGSGFVTKFG